MNLIATDKQYVILGLGRTGISVARYLAARGIRFAVVDTREIPPGVEELKHISSDARCFFGPFDQDARNVLLEAAMIVISPGLSRKLPEVQAALKAGVKVVGDIALYLEEIDASVVAITGSNGKSTVTTLVGEVARSAGLNTVVAGNIGLPVLETLSEKPDLVVLELSSFQLESLDQPTFTVACNLNVSEDHMDRYDSLAEYCMAKQRIFRGARSVVYNLDDKLTQPPMVDGIARFGFGLNSYREEGELRYRVDDDGAALFCENDQLQTVADVKMFGRHNLANALAVYAICDALDLDRGSVKKVLSEFPGLPHRCQWVGEHAGVTFINDSKATNVGSSIAAIEGLREQFSRMALIAGGDGKGAAFDELSAVIQRHVARLVLIGRDGAQIAEGINGDVEVEFASGMQDAVNKAFQGLGDRSVVLLSPACASFDMFSGFEDRGNQFARAVAELSL